MAKISDFSKVKKHFIAVAGGQTMGTEDAIDIRDTVEDKLDDFAKRTQNLRRGRAKDSKGNSINPIDLPLDKALQKYFGIKDIPTFLEVFDVYHKQHNLTDLARVFGLDHLNAGTMEKLMVDHSEFANPMATTEIDSSFRFIIPEIFTQAIRTGYLHSTLHQNWIGSTMNMPQTKITMPQILRGDGMPSRVNEGANIPMGSVSFGKKTVDIFKIGTGFKITDELLMASSIDMLATFLAEVGNDMAIGADSLAFTVLLNGEQADLSESAPVVGVLNTANGFTYKDVKKVFTRMKRLNQPAGRIVTGEDDGIDITGIAQFEGFQGQTKLASIRSIIGVPEVFDIDTYVLPANKILYLCKERAMAKLQYRGMMTERRRNHQNQTEELYISDWINFTIIKRDARVIQDKSVTIVASPFPSYMDVDARIAESYQLL